MSPKRIKFFRRSAVLERDSKPPLAACLQPLLDCNEVIPIPPRSQSIVGKSQSLVGFDRAGRDLEKPGDFSFGRKLRGRNHIHSEVVSADTGPEVSLAACLDGRILNHASASCGVTNSR